MIDDADFDIRDFFPYLLNLAAEETSLGFQQIYKDRYGLLRTEWRVLFHLGSYGGLTARDISTRAKIHKTKVSRAVAKLEQRRFVVRKTFESDRRFEMLQLTKDGATAYQQLRKDAIEYEKAVFSKISKSDVEVMKRCLKQLAEIN